MACSILAIEDTTINGADVTVTAMVEDMRLLYREIGRAHV